MSNSMTFPLAGVISTRKLSATFPATGRRFGFMTRPVRNLVVSQASNRYWSSTWWTGQLFSLIYRTCILPGPCWSTFLLYVDLDIIMAGYTADMRTVQRPVANLFTQGTISGMTKMFYPLFVMTICVHCADLLAARGLCILLLSTGNRDLGFSTVAHNLGSLGTGITGTLVTP